MMGQTFKNNMMQKSTNHCSAELLYLEPENIARECKRELKLTAGQVSSESSPLS